MTDMSEIRVWLAAIASGVVAGLVIVWADAFMLARSRRRARAATMEQYRAETIRIAKELDRRGIRARWR